MSRPCKNLNCTAQVDHPKKNGGYCNNRKAKHWNDPTESAPWWVKCECGAAKCKSKSNPTPIHSDWCPYDKYIKGN